MAYVSVSVDSALSAILIGMVVTTDVVTSTFSCLAVISLVSTTFASLVQPPISSMITLTRVSALSAAAAVLPLPCLGTHITAFPEVIHEVDVVCPKISSQGGGGVP